MTKPIAILQAKEMEYRIIITALVITNLSIKGDILKLVYPLDPKVAIRSASYPEYP
jgi:hypothetical protein